MRNGYINGVLTSVDNQEVIKTGGKIFEICAGVIYREDIEISPFRKFKEKMFSSRQKYEGEHNDLLQSLVKLIKNGLYGVQIRRDIDQSCRCKSQYWIETESMIMY